MTSKNTTLSDVARIAGVSESTVSRALNDSSLVNEKTRKRVKEIAREMDFKVNTLARNLRTQKSNTIAVVLVLSSTDDQSASDPFLLSLLGVVADELSHRNYDLLLCSHPGESLDKVRELVEQKKVEGLIMFGQGDDIDHFTKTVSPSLPVVVWGQGTKSAEYITVGSDNFAGGKIATEHLLQKGRRNICFAGHLSYEMQQRFDGYKEALKQAGISYVHQIDVHFTFAEARRVTSEMIEAGQFHYDAIVAASDSIALGMIKALSDAGMRVPEQVSVVGYDDVAVAAYTNPALTTIRQDTQLGGKKLVELLFQRLGGEKTTSHVLDTRLVVRSSS